MTIGDGDVTELATLLHHAERTGVARGPLSDEIGPIALDDAYRIQDELVDLRVAEGERIVGAKLGLTSRAKQVTMGIAQPIYAWLTDAMVIEAEEPLDHASLIHPRVEPEIVFIMRDELRGPGITPARAMAAVGAVCCGLEVIDSRFADFKFTIGDVVADNASSARFALGAQTILDVDRVPLATVGCSLRHQGRVIAHAAGAAVLGSPAEALAMLANHLGRRGRAVEPGWIIMTGGLTDAVPIGPNERVSARFGGGLGRVFVRTR